MNIKANFNSFCVAAVSSDVNVPLKPELLATHHILQDGQICLFRNDTKPNQKLVNGVWVDMYEDANVASWASRINQKPVVRNTVKVQASPIHPIKNVPGAYQGD
ncbi:hypothetical protein [Acinetobacter sp. YH01024]|uniref:hypothetical protein n=1 Tax=Acinetobacter sp. YH01024 TaxID=2601037 RepID=UPI0015D386E0|nr:hypothetical protein [Acinetobacter sp. YH01024]